MYSAKNDLVLDPFWGTGTTTLAAIASARNSVGIEIDEALKDCLRTINNASANSINDYIHSRLVRHINFVHDRMLDKKPCKYINSRYGFPVVTKQEKDLFFNELLDIEKVGLSTYKVRYSDKPNEKFCRDWSEELGKTNFQLKDNKHKTTKTRTNSQIGLF
jgi:hypothetical protein